MVTASGSRTAVPPLPGRTTLPPPTSEQTVCFVSVFLMKHSFILHWATSKRVAVLISQCCNLYSYAVLTHHNVNVGSDKYTFLSRWFDFNWVHLIVPVLHSDNIQGIIKMDTHLWQCALMAIYSAVPVGYQAAGTMT